MAEEMEENAAQRSISVIIPALNEADLIAATLGRLSGSAAVEVILVDGGSSDNTVEIATQMGAEILVGPANRAQQQNLGAHSAKGSILLFLHADTALPGDFADQIRATLAKPGISAGAFRFRLDSAGWEMALVERMVAIRCRMFGLPYGDQAIFTSRETFNRVGRFADLPVMEDFDLVRRLKKIGRIELADGSAITSARRWREEGVWWMTLKHQLCILGYYLRIPTPLLARLRASKDTRAWTHNGPARW